MTRDEIIADYMAYFGIVDVPPETLGENDLLMIEWAEQLVNSVDLGDVVGRSEQLVCGNPFCKNGKVFFYDKEHDCRVCNKTN